MEEASAAAALISKGAAPLIRLIWEAWYPSGELSGSDLKIAILQPNSARSK